MKRLLILFAVLAILPAAALGQNETSVSLVGPGSATGTFTVLVAVGQVTALDSADFIVSFDSTNIRFDNVSGGAFSTSTPLLNSNLNKVLLNVPGLSGLSGSGSIAKLHFTSLNAGSSQIGLSDITLGNNLAQEIASTFAGNITVAISSVVGSTPEPDEPEGSGASSGGDSVSDFGDFGDFDDSGDTGDTSGGGGSSVFQNQSSDDENVEGSGLRQLDQFPVEEEQSEEEFGEEGVKPGTEGPEGEEEKGSPWLILLIVISLLSVSVFAIIFLHKSEKTSADAPPSEHPITPNY
jgi:hypothetical protein